MFTVTFCLLMKNFNFYDFIKTAKPPSFYYICQSNISRMRSIFIKEINSFFSSIVGYVALLVFLVACGLFLWIIPDYSILGYGYASMERFFEIAPWLLLLLVPAVTMRSFADEFRTGTIEW